MSTHSKYSPSSYSRWSKCPGSLNLIEAHPEIKPSSSKYAEEGTLAHELAAEWLGSGKEPFFDDATMREHVKTYVDYCTDLMYDDDQYWIEEKVNIPDSGLYGTADFISLKGKTLHIVDYKHGAGLAVDVIGNSQLRIYAIAAIMSLPKIREEGFKNVELTIVQPRCFHSDGPIRSETVTLKELKEFKAEVLAAIEATKNPTAELNAGTHCRFCPVSSICPELKKDAFALAAKDFEPVIDVRDFSKALDMIPKLEAWISAVNEAAYAAATRGEKIENYKLSNKRATRKWGNDPNIAAKLEGELGLSPPEIYEKKMRSPAQIEKLINRDDIPILNKLCVKESSGLVLVHISDPRPAVAVGPLAEFEVLSED